MQNGMLSQIEGQLAHTTVWRLRLRGFCWVRWARVKVIYGRSKAVGRWRRADAAPAKGFCRWQCGLGLRQRRGPGPAGSRRDVERVQLAAVLELGLDVHYTCLPGSKGRARWS